jgi:MFS family permease
MDEGLDEQSGGVSLDSQLQESRRAIASVFRNPGLRRVNIAFAASIVGDWAYMVAVSVYAYGHGGATAVGAFGVARYVSMALLGPPMSMLADRHPRKLVMMGADLSRAVVVVVGATLIATHGPPAAVYAAALVTAVLSLAFRPAQASLLPTLARDARELTSANVVASTVEGVGFFAGPLLAGILLSVASVPIVYLVNAATFLVSAALLAGLRVPADVDVGVAGGTQDHGDVASEAIAAEAGFLHEALAGFRTIRRDRNLLVVTVLMTAQTVVAGAALVFQVALALDLLGLGDSGVGLLGTFLGVGSIVGAFIALVVAARGHIATDFGVGVLLWSAPLLLIVAFPRLGVTLVVMATIGIANAIVDINAYTIVQRLAPTAVMGRVFGALESVVIMGMAVGALLMPLFISTVGLRAGLAIIGTGVALVALGGMKFLRRIDTQVLAPPDLALLRRLPAFAVLPPPVLERLAHALISMTVPANTVVIREGDRGDRFWVIERGTALVLKGDEIVGELGPGDGFGEIALLRDIPRQATVRAGDDGELVLKGLDRDDFLPAVTGHGDARAAAEAAVDRWLAPG